MATANTQGQDSQGVATKEEKKQAIIDLLKKNQQIIRKNSSKPIEPGQVLLEFNNVSVLRKNTLAMIKGKTGVHKSRVIQEICSMLITGEVSRKRALGMQVMTEQPTRVIYVDTERNLTEHFPEAIQAIRKHAGHDEFQDHPSLQYHSFIGLDRFQRLEGIKLILQSARAQRTDNVHIVLVLDVVSDCISNFNDLVETYILTDEFAKCMNDYDVSFLVVIHENPDAIRSTKARGHLGTEVGNKASMVLQISKAYNEPDKFLLTIEKSRSSRVPDPIYVYYNDNFGRLLLCEAPAPKPDKTILQILDYLTTLDKTEISKIDLEAGTAVKRGTLDRRLETIIQNDLRITKDGKSYRLEVVTIGKKSVVRLQSDELEDEV